ncbi:hypothetical protein D8B26_002211 [Coccidioides posadasii str. Silveira]|uniref:MYB DNA-binding domain-containing protein n=1 Tax=Coccidioides posadasii (strain RMSCC 757 / Silveira) TaxID=443226 RepID=E9DDJ5_COCPS|nr:MYB DNA-binding domain-containing protein [Coccidioides posadasii str. Silveira]QVM07512.1 hypothetical protein D8B26_002211 [Coccidioides posadasii str. Silveira]
MAGSPVSVRRAFYFPQGVVSLPGDSGGDTEPDSDSVKTLDSNIPQLIDASQETVKLSVPARRHQTEFPAGQHNSKRRSKWSPEEDESIIRLRGSRTKWEDVSKGLPGRSAMSCRLHYQNHLERSEWDDAKQDRLACLYERYKEEMWAKIAVEMAVPWRTAEAMHW